MRKSRATGEQGLPVRLITIVISCRALQQRYPGGVLGYLDHNPGAPLVWPLLAQRAMSGGDVGLVLDDLRAYGLELGRDVALGDQHLGELEGAPFVSFRRSADGWAAVTTVGERS